MERYSILFNRLREHAKARMDIATAHRLIEQIADVADEDEDGRFSNEVRFTTAVIAFGRTFAPTRNGRAYPTKELAKRTGYSREIHEHLIVLRNKILAHSDDDVYQANVSEAIQVFETDIRQAAVTKIYVTVHRFAGFHNRVFQASVLEHLEACGQGAEQDWLRDADEFFSICNTRDVMIARARKEDDLSSSTDPTSITELSGMGQAYFDIEMPHDAFSDKPQITFTEEYRFATYIYAAAPEAIPVFSASGEMGRLEVKEPGLGAIKR